MGTFRSNLNSISRTYSLTALKKHLATCFQQLHNKALQAQQKFSLKCENYKHLNLTQSSEAHFKSFNRTFREIFTRAPRCPRSGERVEIVTKILSSTLIATSATTGSGSCGNEEPCRNMTITDVGYLSLREEYPDLDVEVRSILTARAQEGASIAEIKEDYRKNTGTKFPVLHHITEFLLSIPFVTAYCNENGTRIFNVLPSHKTKHIHEMVQQQKPRQPPPQQQQPAYGDMPPPMLEPRRLPSYLFKSSTQKANAPVIEHHEHHGWYQQGYGPYGQYGYQACAANVLYNGQSTPLNGQQMEVDPVPALPPPTMRMDIDHSNSEPDHTPTNNYYQDNCNYLFNRLYNAPTVPPRNTLSANNSNTNPNNNNIVRQNLQPIRLNKCFNIAKNHNNALSQLNNLNQQPIESALALEPIVVNNNNNNNNFNVKRKRSNLNTNFMNPVLAPQSRSSAVSSPTGTKSSRHSESLYTTDSDYEAHLLDFTLLGDDFLLYLARMELRCKFKKYEKVLQSGLCVSGQSIGAAHKRILRMEDSTKHIIVNIGSVDIMKGRPLVQIQHDFRELINVMQRKSFTPILTTLAPLANYAHDEQLKLKLQRFNRFIIREYKCLQVIDIWSCLVNERGHILFDCFQNAPRTVTGTSEPYVFWNKIGRQRVLQMIEANLEY